MNARAVEAALAARFGLAPRDGWESELPNALREVARHRGIFDPGATTEAVLAHEELLREVAERLTVGESYFYRHPEQLEVTVAHLLPRLSGSALEPTTVWSAGCSRGEEPYTLAMMLERRVGREAFGSTRIVGTDLHAGAIAQAREGRYCSWSLRATPAWARERDFDEVPGGFRIAARHRERVEFVNTSLIEHAESFPEQSIDAVLFRNVGIYLTPEALGRFFRALTRALRPGGLLVLSPTDPQPALATLARAPELGTAVYQRTGARACGATRTVRSSAAERPNRAARADASARTTDVRGLVQQASELADEGRFAEANLVLDRIVLERTDAADAWYVRGQIHLAEGRYERAYGDFERAGALAPADPTPRFFAAIALSKLGRAASAVSVLEALELELERATDEPSAEASGGARPPGLLEGVRFELSRLR